jgi:hypothetical protein
MPLDVIVVRDQEFVASSVAVRRGEMAAGPSVRACKWLQNDDMAWTIGSLKTPSEV